MNPSDLRDHYHQISEKMPYSENRNYDSSVLTQKFCRNCASDKGYYCLRRELNLMGKIRSDGCDLYIPLHP